MDDGKTVLKRQLKKVNALFSVYVAVIKCLVKKSPIQTVWKTTEVFAVWDFCRWKRSLKPKKTRTIVNGVFENMTGTLKSLNGTEFEGYEIHMGKSEFSVPYMTKLSNGKQDGISQGDVHGSYVHGIFDKCADKIVKCLCDKKGIDSTKIKSIDMAELKEREYDRLADMVRESLDMDLIYKIINKEV